MTESSLERDREPKKYPLSYTQEFFVQLDQGEEAGAFGLHFVMASGLRVTGPVDIAVLQGALDDVVERHELLRTVVVRDCDQPHQLVHPPCRVPLEVSDIPPANDKSRELMAEELLIAAELEQMSASQMPLLRARLCKFDDRDSLLIIKTHHSTSDGWSMQVILRDLGEFYAARASGRPAKLPPVRQYRDYVAWQRAGDADADGGGALAYWREKLRGAREFTVPGDQVAPEIYSRPYSLTNYPVGADVVAAASELATASRSSLFMMLLAACYVLGYKITGATDLSIRAFTTGRNEPQFQDTMGLFMNLVPFRTDISACASFRDILAAARDTCVDAYAHEIAWGLLEQEIPEFTRSRREDPLATEFILGMFQPQFGDPVLPIAEGAQEIRDRILPEPEHPDIPRGLVWNLDLLTTGELVSGVLFNLDDLDEPTVDRWAADFNLIITTAVSEPDRDWRTF